MSRRESLWAKILRFFMPANGAHARARETGEMPVLDEEDYGGFYDREGHWHEGERDPDGPWGDDYDEWSPEDEPDGDPFYRPAPWLRETMLDLTAPTGRPYLREGS